MTQPITTAAVSPQRTNRALEARRARTDASLIRVQDAVDRMLKDKTPISVAAVARRSGVSRTFLYDNPEARQIISSASAHRPPGDEPKATQPNTRHCKPPDANGR